MFHKPEWKPFRDNHAVGKPIANNKRSGSGLSAKGQRRIRKAINWLTYLSSKRNVQFKRGKVIRGFSVGFITLTLPAKQMHSHKEIKQKCLNLFLVNLRKNFNVHNYLWKAELQKNGNIHFHLTIDKFIHFGAIRKYWNLALSKLGYISDYKRIFEGMSFAEYKYWRKQNGEIDNDKIKKAYNFGVASNWSNPNTTDVHSVKKVRNLASYLSKYLAKPVNDEQKDGIIKDSEDSFSGRVWYCSQSLSALGTVVVNFNRENLEIFNRLRAAKTSNWLKFEWAECIYFKISKLPAMLQNFLRQQLVSRAIDINYQFPSDLPAKAA